MYSISKLKQGIEEMTVHHELAEFITGVLDLHLKINAIYHINRIKEKHHLVISIYAGEKVIQFNIYS